MTGAATVARHLTVRGRVQGVFFRDWTVSEARRLGLAGWVRNRADGSVEIVGEGTAEAVAALERACHEGPPAARVDTVEAEDVAVAGLAGFERRATG